MLILAGCGNAKWTSIYREYKISDAHGTQSALIDAKQRAIISSPIIKDGDAFDRGSRAFIVCAEPSPDAVSALSSALSASLGAQVAGQGGGEGSLALALSEAVGKLGKRNATIQLLRDGFYRQCEAYLNGVIDEQSFVKVSNRYVDAMVTLLAIEQVTSPTAGDAPLVIRTSTASADTGVTGQSGPDGSSPPPVGSVDQTDQQPDESSPPPADAAVPTGGGDKPQGGGGSASGKSTTKGEASAGGGDVNIDISGLKGGQVDQSVAAEVRSMVSIFLEKDSRDQCLDRIGRFADRLEYGSEKPSDDEKKLIDNFTQLCFDLIRTSVGAHIWGPRADDTGADDTGKAPAELMQPQLLIPKEES
jgi:hypothetical protein